MCSLHDREKSCNLSEIFMEKHGKSNYQSGWYGDCVETMWRETLLWRFHGKISLEIARVFYGENMDKTW